MAGGRSLRIKQEKLRRATLVQGKLYSSAVSSPPMPSSTIAYPPIYISPSNFDPFTPSPSPLPAATTHHALQTAALVGGAVTGVVAIAATATVISTVAGKVGFSCLLGPIFNLFSFLGGKILGPCAGRLQGLRNTLDKYNPARKRGSRRPDKAADDNESGVHSDGHVLYNIRGGSSTKTTKAEYTAAAAHSSAKSPLRDVIKDHDVETATHTPFLVTSVSDYAKSVVKKHTEIVMESLNEQIASAHGYAEALFSMADNASGTHTSLQKSSDANLNEASELKATANYAKQPAGTLTLSRFDEAIEGEAENLKNTTANENAAGLKRLHRKQAGRLLVEEQMVLPRRQGKPLIATTNGEADESEEEEVEQRVLGARRSGQVYIVQSASDAHTEIQLQDMGNPSYKHKRSRGESASDACMMELQLQEMGNPSHKHETSSAASCATHSMGLVPTDTARTLGEPGTMLPPAVQGSSMTSSMKGKQAQGDVMKLGRKKRKRPRNLGRVSFSFEVSAHRLRFFTVCRTGGTYGSPPSSPADHVVVPGNTVNNYYHDHNITNTGSHDYYSTGQPYPRAHYHVNPLSNASHYNLSHQLYHPPQQSILVQCHPDPSPTLAQNMAPLSPPSY